MIVRTALVVLATLLGAGAASAQWVWDPETGWTNIRYVGRKTPEQLRQEARKLEAAKDHSGASKTREKIANKFPQHEDAPRAMFMAAESAFQAKDYLRADELYLKYVRRYQRDDRYAKILGRRYDIGRGLVLVVVSGERARPIKTKSINFFPRLINTGTGRRTWR